MNDFTSTNNVFPLLRTRRNAVTIAFSHSMSPLAWPYALASKSDPCG